MLITFHLHIVEHTQGVGGYRPPYTPRFCFLPLVVRDSVGAATPK